MWVAGKITDEAAKLIESDPYASGVMGIDVQSRGRGDLDDGAYYDKGLAGLYYAANLLKIADSSMGIELKSLLDETLDRGSEVPEGGCRMTTGEARRVLSLVDGWRSVILPYVDEDGRVRRGELDLVRRRVPDLLTENRDADGNIIHWIEHPIWYAETAILLLEVACQANLEIWFE